MRECCAATGVNAPVYRAAPGYRSLYAIGGRPPLAEDMRRRLQQWIYRSAATFTASRFNFAGPCGRASPFAAWQKSSPFGHRHSSYALDRPAPLKRNAKGAARERAFPAGMDNCAIDRVVPAGIRCLFSILSIAESPTAVWQWGFRPLTKLDSVYMRLSQNSQPNSDTHDMNSRKER